MLEGSVGGLSAAGNADFDPLQFDFWFICPSMASLFGEHGHRYSNALSLTSLGLTGFWAGYGQVLASSPRPGGQGT